MTQKTELFLQIFEDFDLWVINLIILLCQLKRVKRRLSCPGPYLPKIS